MIHRRPGGAGRKGTSACELPQRICPRAVDSLDGTDAGWIPLTVNLGGGHVVPYPEPKDAVATKIGKANRRTDTLPEVRLRSALHRRGHRYRKDLLVRVDGARMRPDISFPRWRVAVFVDGCFWHGCREHQRIPRSNRDYWVPKLTANVERDRRVDAALVEAEWEVVRIWEHVDLNTAVDLVEATLRTRRANPRSA